MTMLRESMNVGREPQDWRHRGSRIDPMLVALALTAFASVSSAIAQPSFQGLGDLPGGVVGSRAFGVSNDGDVVVGDSSAIGQHPFRWTQAGGMVNLYGGVGGNFSATGASADGAVVVGWGNTNSPGSTTAAFRWTQASGMVALGDLPGGQVFSQAFAVSADGTVIAGGSSSSASGNQTEAFRWTQATGMVALGDIPGGVFASQANAISADASVIVGSANGGGGGSFRWSEATGMVDLGALPGGTSDSGAWAVSADGSTIAGRAVNSAGVVEAYRWTAATGMVGLGFLAGATTMSVARGVSGDGSIIVGHSGNNVSGEAFIWDPAHGMRSLRSVLENDYGLDLTGWLLRVGYAITPDGRTIVGQGVHNGAIEAFLANLGQGCGLAGDLDHDGSIGLSDLTILLEHFGTASGATYADGDLDDDDDVDLNDLTPLLSSFGTTCP